MLSSPLDYASSLRIGTVIFVSPDEIKVQLEIDSPDSVALNATTPRAFPRINGYLLIPCDSGHLVGQVQWITIENSEYPKRKGLRDFGLIDLPFPMRKLSLAPLGCLQKKDTGFVFYRGIEAFPSVGDTVLLPTDDQLHAIVTSGKNLRVKIGTSPLAGNADVMIDPDRLFGRHLAVLGNTGSGKSCSVAGLIRWSLDEAQNEIERNGVQKACNARFIILDPNAEYIHAFHDMIVNEKKTIRRYSVEPQDGSFQLFVPIWMWNSAEWDALSQASEKTQKPLLKRALAEVKMNNTDNAEEIDLHARLSVVASKLNRSLQDGESYEAWKMGTILEAFNIDLEKYRQEYTRFSDEIQQIEAKIAPLIVFPYKQNNKFTGSYPASLLFPILEEITALMSTLAGNDISTATDEDIPKQFDLSIFIRHLKNLIDIDRNPQYYDAFLLRLNSIIQNTKMKLVIDNHSVSLSDWLESLFGNTTQSVISIVDLSLLPSDMNHLITAILARLLFESLQRYRKIQKEVLPTVFVVEEAHSFIQKYNPDTDNSNAATLCCKVFEKIAREGRKFGLGLVLSSQRPSELSPTVLSQCNTFLLHRISNDKDQELVHRLLPDNLHGILRDLPILPSRNAILLGWASELPVLVRMNELPQEQRPQSDDPDFWEVWTRNVERTVNWETIADDWQNKPCPEQQIPPQSDSTANSQNEEEENSFTPMDSWYDEQNPNGR